jgi:hypothetical protein
MIRILYVLVGIGIVAACGVVHGFWTDRWTLATKVQEAASRLDAVPRTIGEWEGEDLELPADEKRAAGGAGYLQRRYLNRQTGMALSVLLVCGRSGPVSVHTPDVCYRGAGYDIVGDTVRRTVEGADGARAATFEMIEVENVSRSANGNRLRIFWAWSGGQGWEAPRYPRLALSHYPVLFKLYVIQDASRGDEKEKEQTALGFLRCLLPELQRGIFNAP